MDLISKHKFTGYRLRLTRILILWIFLLGVSESTRASTRLECSGPEHHRVAPASVTMGVDKTDRKWELSSPSGILTLTIREEDAAIRLSLRSGSNILTEIRTARFVTGEGTINEFYHIEKVTEQSIRDSWQPLYGERDKITNHHHEATITLSNSKNPLSTLTLWCRLYDEGMAFRFTFDTGIPEKLELHEDLTTFIFQDDHVAWVSTRAQSEILKSSVDRITSAVERPLVIRQGEQSYLALGDAGVVDFARTKFIASGPSHTIGLLMDGQVNLKQAGFYTPWRYIMVGKSPAELLEKNYFILNLNEPPPPGDFSWIRPGKVIREVTLTTEGGLACVDFAVRAGLQFVEFDAGWYGPENDPESDATTVTVDPKRSSGPLDLQRVIDYASARGIGIILYVNHRALERQLDELLPLYRSWGVKGLKFGFVNVGEQKWTAWLHEAVRKAAEFQLMVDVHDEYRPTGYSRTYPNLMTQEGIRGDEESPSIESTLNTLFTRMIAGAGDYTNCYFAPRVWDKLGGETGQMAKAILLYSPWQFLFWYDRPEDSPQKKGGAGSSEGIIRESEALEFYRHLPTVWDDIKVLEGEIGQFATIARKSGHDWFVGSLTAGRDRLVRIPLPFLDEGIPYEATLYYQDAPARQERQVSIDKFTVDRDSVVERTLPADSGVAIILRRR